MRSSLGFPLLLLLAIKFGVLLVPTHSSLDSQGMLLCLMFFGFVGFDLGSVLGGELDAGFWRWVGILVLEVNL